MTKTVHKTLPGDGGVKEVYEVGSRVVGVYVCLQGGYPVTITHGTLDLTAHGPHGHGTSLNKDPLWIWDLNVQ